MDECPLLREEWNGTLFISVGSQEVWGVGGGGQIRARNPMFSYDTQQLFLLHYQNLLCAWRLDTYLMRFMQFKTCIQLPVQLNATCCCPLQSNAAC